MRRAEEEGRRRREEGRRRRTSFLRRRRLSSSSSSLPLLLLRGHRLHLDLRGEQRLQGLEHRPLAAPDAAHAPQGQRGEDGGDGVRVLRRLVGSRDGCRGVARRGSCGGRGGGTRAPAAPAGELEHRQPGPDPRHGQPGRDAAVGAGDEGEGDPLHGRRAGPSAAAAFVHGDRRGRPRPDGRRALVRAPLYDHARVVAVVGRGALAPLVFDGLQGLRALPRRGRGGAGQGRTRGRRFRRRCDGLCRRC